MHNTTFQRKWQDLLKALKSKNKVAIACSGGLDSRLLAYATTKADIEYIILHVEGVHIPKEEEEILKEFAKSINIQVTSIHINPLEIKEIQNNPIDRCYYCKSKIFTLLKEQAQGYALCDGSNTDDLEVYRPGHKALKELSISSPYLEANISKQDIYAIAQEIDLPFYEQKAQACLLTRFNYNICLVEKDILWLDYAESELKACIASPFRIRANSQNIYELHIEAGSLPNLQEIEAKLATLASKNTNINKKIEILFFDSLRSYFDKKHDIS